MGITTAKVPTRVTPGEDLGPSERTFGDGYDSKVSGLDGYSQSVERTVR